MPIPLPSSRDPSWRVLLALTVGLGLTAWFGTLSREIAVHLDTVWRDSASHPERTFAMLLTPGTGEFVLPPESRGVLRLLRTYDIASFDLSPALMGNEFVAQRTIEGTWPRRYEPGARAYFMTTEEAVALPATTRRAEYHGIVLIRRD